MATKEELLKKRTKELAIIRASNEMLEDVKKGLIERGGDNESLIKEIESAQSENLLSARNTHGASPEEVYNTSYHGASIGEIKKYEERLKKKGLTDEQLHQKDISIASVGKKKTKKNSSDSNEENTVKEEKVKRRKRKSKDEEAPKKETTTVETVIEEDNNSKIIEVEENKSVEVDKVMKETESKTSIKIEDYDLSSIPPYVQYDMIPLPSNGECYSHKKSRIPVAYLTAADENIITSPNMYRDGKLLDVILRRKILDKSVNVDELCTGDRDAIILWLRATSYGDDFPIIVTNPDTGKQYNITVKLSQFKYDDFNLKGDENGFFDYKAKNGDIIKFRYLSKSEEDELRRKLTASLSNETAVDIMKNAKAMKESLKNLNVTEEESSNLNEDIDEIISVVNEKLDLTDEDMEMGITMGTITEQMILYTREINGNRDREFIRNYIENMRAGDAYAYRNYFSTNKPGIDFSINVDIPESDGGGSFTTFLRIDDTVFLNF